MSFNPEKRELLCSPPVQLSPVLDLDADEW